MTKQRLLIHCGPPKTGSTAIQSYIRAASEAGSLRNVYYPLIDKKEAVDSIESGNGSSLCHYLRHEGGFQKPIGELEKKVHRVLGEYRNSNRPVLISSEGFWPLDLNSAKMLVEIFEKYGFAPELLFVVRPFQEVWQSQISQSIRGGEFEGFESVRGAKQHIERIQLWSSFNFPMHAIPYDSKRLIDNFLDFLGESHLKNFDFGFDRVNTRLSGTEARILRKSFSISNQQKWPVQIANELRSFYRDIDAQIREKRELEVMDYTKKNLQIPDSWQPKHGYTKLESARTLHETRLNKDFWELLMVGAEAPSTYTFDNTPALAAIEAEPVLSELEYDLLHKTTMKVLIATQNHAGNLQAMLTYGSPFSQLILSNDGKLEFNDSSQLVRSRLGFDPVHYLILNPDVDRAGANPEEHFKAFGKSEGRYTKIRQRSESNSLLLNEKPLFLVHSPRTGGTALREMLTDEVGEELVTRSHRDIAIEKNNTYSNFEFLLEESGLDTASKNAVLVGHFPARVKDLLKFDHYSAIFVREPIARSISMLRKESREQNLSVEELLKDPDFLKKYIKDAQCRILTSPVSMDSDSGIFDVNETMLGSAKAKLREFDFLGLYEKYNESIWYFDSIFKTNLQSRIDKVNESPEIEMPEGVSEVIQPLVAMDQKLYEYAVELFNSRISMTNKSVR